MSKFHTLTVSDITKETADCVSVCFQVPENLKKEYTFIQGQYLTLRMMVNGKEIRRSYSICTSPVSDTELRVAVKRVQNGKGSNYINNLVKVGDKMDVMIPMGNFFSKMDASNKKHYVLFAGGSGITPILSILKTVLASEPNSRITLFYGNNDEASIIFNKLISDLSVKYPERLKVVHILNAAPANHPLLHTGLMTKEKVMSLIENYVGLNETNEFFVCGPIVMMDNVRDTLNSLKIKEEVVHIEYFTAPAEPIAEESKSASNSNAFEANVTIILDGDELPLRVPSDKSILQAALDAGLDAPYACTAGSCCTCRAKLEEGEVDMKLNYALSASEVKQGYILTCQSYAKSEELVVNYDKAN